MIIFGIRRLRTQLAVVLAVCQFCTRPCAHTVIRTRRWFTLFFLPVIPLGTQYVSVCSMCGAPLSIDREAAGELQRQGARQRAQPAQSPAIALRSILGTTPEPQPQADWSTGTVPPMPPIQPPRAL